MAIHPKVQFWSVTYNLSLYILCLAFLVIFFKRRQPTLIAVSCLFIWNQAWLLVYAWSTTEEGDFNGWIRDHKKLNDVVFTFCELGFGYGLSILVLYQWKMSFKLPLMLGPGITKKLKPENEPEDVAACESKLKKRLICEKYFFWAV